LSTEARENNPTLLQPIRSWSVASVPTATFRDQKLIADELL
jgi:hypothetical protein